MIKNIIPAFFMPLLLDKMEFFKQVNIKDVFTPWALPHPAFSDLIFHRN